MFFHCQKVSITNWLHEGTLRLLKGNSLLSCYEFILKLSLILQQCVVVLNNCWFFEKWKVQQLMCMHVHACVWQSNNADHFFCCWAWGQECGGHWRDLVKNNGCVNCAISTLFDRRPCWPNCFVAFVLLLYYFFTLTGYVFKFADYQYSTTTRPEGFAIFILTWVRHQPINTI